jgi:2'-phosphotransferase
MATAVLPSMQGLSLDREIMPPSPVSQNSSRHGRSRHGGSVVKGKSRGRGYSVVDDREVLIAKALSWALKRTVDEDDEQEDGDNKLVADSEGWVDCEEIVSSTPPPFRSSLTGNSYNNQILQPSRSLLQSSKLLFPPPHPNLVLD